MRFIQVFLKISRTYNSINSVVIYVDTIDRRIVTSW